MRAWRKRTPRTKKCRRSWGRCLSFFGPRPCALLACPGALLLCCRHGPWPFLPPHAAASGRASVHYWPVLLPSSVVLDLLRSPPSAAIGLSCCGVPLLRAAPLCAIGQSCCVPAAGFGNTYSPSLDHASAHYWPVLLLSSFVHGWPFYSYLSLLPCAIGQSCCLPPLSSAWFFFRPPGCCGLGGMFSCTLTRGTSGLQPDASPIVDTFGGFWVPAVLRLPFVSS